MDGTRFDALAKGLASARSRRGVMKGLGAAMLGAAGLARLGDAEAKPACRGAGHPCEGNQTCCADLVCVVSGPGAAKRCTACAAGEVVHNGACCTPATCPAGACGAVDDGCGGTLNCGQTNALCTSDSDCCSGVCVGGACLAGKVGDGEACDTDDDCVSGNCCVNVCVPDGWYTTPINCGKCGNVCPGYSEANDNVTCSAGTCTFSCQGEHYDVNNDPSDGCEKTDSPQGNHTTSTAVDLGTHTCADIESHQIVTGSILSDKRVHESPAIVGFDATTGSAPDYFVVHASGGALCVNTTGGTFTVNSGTASCYTLTVITDKDTGSIAGSGHVPEVNYSDGTDVVFKVAKTCSTSTIEAANYTIDFHL